MRWKAVVTGLALWGAAAGCKQQCFMTECEFQSVRSHCLPARLETDPTIGDRPTEATAHLIRPSTVDDPDRPARWLTLAEAIAIALEQGTIGSQSTQAPGIPNDNLVTFSGRGVFGSDAIRVLALDPAIAGTDIEASLAKFDARLTSALTFSTTDNPVGTALQNFQANQQGNQLNAIETQDAAFNVALIKPLPTGGVAGITFRTDYQFTNLPARVNPSYRPAVQFQFEQPLLQGFGVEINQLRAQHPGSVLTPFPTGGRVEGILITRLRFDQARAEFQRQVHHMLLNVEVAYWNLYGSYWNLYSREQALRQAFEAWRINDTKLKAGRAAPAEAAQSRGQYELFRSQRLTALGQVLENERRLRRLLGLPTSDNTRLVPADAPTLAPVVPDWDQAVHEATALRPELILAREDLKFRQLDLINQKNLLKPDLRFLATYDFNGIGNRLDGPLGALANLGNGEFSSSQVGLRLDMPLGFRDANAAVRTAYLNLQRSYEQLREQEKRSGDFLAQQYRSVLEFHKQITIVRSQRQAFAQQLQAKFQEFLAGRGTIDVLLEAQRFWADALANEYNFIVQYNNALATFEFAKGTILQHDNVHIAEGPLPACVQTRAAEHERERSRALVLRERAAPVPHAAQSCEAVDVTTGMPQTGELIMPHLPEGRAPSLPSLFEAAPTAPKQTVPEAVQPAAALSAPVAKAAPIVPPKPAMPQPPGLAITSPPATLPSFSKPAGEPAVEPKPTGMGLVVPNR